MYSETYDASGCDVEPVCRVCESAVSEVVGSDSLIMSLT